MAFLKKKSKLPAVFVRILLIFILSAALIGVLFYLYQLKMDEMKKLHGEEIEKFRFQLYQLDRQALVPKQDIEFGTMLSMDLFEQVSMKMEISQDLLIDETDMGKTNLVKLPKGIPVTKHAVVSEPPGNDLRKVEFNMFLLQTDQKQGDFIDIRIAFPNAENYIVLSKKQIKAMEAADNLLWLWLDETEIHQISSAIIDAYLHPGTKLYAATYIQPTCKTAFLFIRQSRCAGLMRTTEHPEKSFDAWPERRGRYWKSLQAMTLDESQRFQPVLEKTSKADEALKNEIDRELKESQDSVVTGENTQPDNMTDSYH